MAITPGKLRSSFLVCFGGGVLFVIISIVLLVTIAIPMSSWKQTPITTVTMTQESCKPASRHDKAPHSEYTYNYVVDGQTLTIDGHCEEPSKVPSVVTYNPANPSDAYPGTVGTWYGLATVTLVIAFLFTLAGFVFRHFYRKSGGVVPHSRDAISERNHYIIIGAGIVVGLIVWFVANSSRATSTIDSFEKCADAGYPIMESYPERCATPDGKSFTKEYPAES